jgi:hypothetical protein
MSSADELKKLKELLDSGVLTQEEFDKEKNKLLDDQPQADKSSSDTENKDSKKEKIKKRYIVAGVFFLLYMIGSIGGESSSDNISTTNSSSSSNSSSTCETWSSQTANNASKMANIMDDVADNATDASNGAISFSTFESTLKSDLQRAKNIYNNQLSLTPNSENRSSHNYFIDALEDLIDGLDFAILGVQNDDASYIELGIIYIEDAGLNSTLATSALSNC